MQFTVNFFVGKVPDELPYSSPQTLVGSVLNFATEAMSLGTSPAGCGNCHAQAADRVLSSGRVVLTNSLITRWKHQMDHEPHDGSDRHVLGSMDPSDVVPFLQANLQWRITSQLGELVQPEQIPSLKVVFVLGKADHFKDENRPSIFRDYVPAYEVTENKPNGANEGDGLYPPGYKYVAGGTA